MHGRIQYKDYCYPFDFNRKRNVVQRHNKYSLYTSFVEDLDPKHIYVDEIGKVLSDYTSY